MSVPVVRRAMNRPAPVAIHVCALLAIALVTVACNGDEHPAAAVEESATPEAVTPSGTRPPRIPEGPMSAGEYVLGPAAIEVPEGYGGWAIAAEQNATNRHYFGVSYHLVGGLYEDSCARSGYPLDVGDSVDELVAALDAQKLELDAVEQLALAVASGSDNVTVGDLSGTELTDVEIGLSATTGSPDARADTITVLGTPGADDVTISGTEPGAVAITGLTATVSISGADGPLDRLIVDAGAGDDYVDASGLTNNAVALTVFGGEGADFVFGSGGNDTLDGGPQDDSLLGSDGDDVLVGGDGDDVLLGGDGNDTLNCGNGDDIEIQG